MKISVKIPLEIFDKIIRYTDDPRLIAPFKNLLYKETIEYLLGFANVKDAIIDKDIVLLNFLRKRNKDVYDSNLGEVCYFLLTVRLIIHEEMPILNFLRKYNVDIFENKITYVVWKKVTRDYRFSDEMILEFKNYVDLEYISKKYDLTDKSIISLADVLDWHILVRSRILSESIQIKYLDVHFNCLDLIRYQLVSNNQIRSFFCSNQYYIKKYLIIYKKLTSVIFREYIHIFDDSSIINILDCNYSEKFFAETSDLMNMTIYQ